MDENGCVLVLSFSDVESSSLVKKILKCDELPEVVNIHDNINVYPHLLDNKYYTNEILFCTMKEQNEKLNNEFVNMVQAIIIYYDPENKDSFSEVQKWVPFAEKQCLEICLLLCDSCKEDSNPAKSEILKWCTKRQFSLIELNPDKCSDDDENDDDDCGDLDPIEEIIKTLHAHKWTNLKMKNTNQTKNLEDHTASLEKFNKFQKECEEKLGLAPEDDKEKSSDEDNHEAYAQEEKFENFFQELAIMKETARGLEGPEKYDYAEAVVKKFWLALGNPEDEFDTQPAEPIVK